MVSVLRVARRVSPKGARDTGHRGVSVGVFFGEAGSRDKSVSTPLDSSTDPPAIKP